MIRMTSWIFIFFFFFKCEAIDYNSSIVTNQNSKIKQCPSGWISFEYGEKCFLLNSTKASFIDNFNWCNQLNSTMISIHSKEENEFIRMLLNDNANGLSNLDPKQLWLGGYFYHYYLWMDKSQLDFLNWKQNKSNCYNENLMCLIFMTSSGNWNDTIAFININQTLTASQICQIDLKLPINSNVTPFVLKEKLERDYKINIMNSTLIRSILETKNKLGFIDKNYSSLKEITDQLNMTLRKEIYLRMIDHEKVKLLLSNYTESLSKNIDSLEEDNKKLYYYFKFFIISIISSLLILLIANILILRSYQKVKKKYIHPNAITALLEFNETNR